MVVYSLKLMRIYHPPKLRVTGKHIQYDVEQLRNHPVEVENGTNKELQQGNKDHMLEMIKDIIHA